MRADFQFRPLRKEVIHEENPDRNDAGPVRSCSDDRLGMRLQRRLVGVRHSSGTACNGVTAAGEQGTRSGGGEDAADEAGETGGRQGNGNVTCTGREDGKSVDQLDRSGKSPRPALCGPFSWRVANADATAGRARPRKTKHFHDERLRAADFFVARFFVDDFFAGFFFADFFVDFFVVFLADFFTDFLAGTLPPSRRASESPMAMACLRLFTFLPDEPLRNDPVFRSCIAFLTFDCAFLPYFAIISSLSIETYSRASRYRA
jgi:hypothetical protein